MDVLLVLVGISPSEFHINGHLKFSVKFNDFWLLQQNVLFVNGPQSLLVKVQFVDTPVNHPLLIFFGMPFCLFQVYFIS